MEWTGGLEMNREVGLGATHRAEGASHGGWSGLAGTHPHLEERRGGPGHRY